MGHFRRVANIHLLKNMLYFSLVDFKGNRFHCCFFPRKLKQMEGNVGNTTELGIPKGGPFRFEVLGKSVWGGISYLGVSGS